MKPTERNMKKRTPMHIMMKLLKTSDQEKFKGSQKEKVRGGDRMMTDFLSEATQEDSRVIS